MANSGKPITLAAITGAHGVAGEVRLKLFGDGLAALKSHKRFNGGALTLSSLRDDNKGGAIARFAESRNRNEAEALRGTALTVSRADLPDLEDGEYYHADLIGLAVQDEAGNPLGESLAVHNFGAGDIVEIRLPAQEGRKARNIMMPMRAEAVLSWDLSTMTVARDFIGEE